MMCHWFASLRNFFLCFILHLWVLKHHWMTSDFSVSPELVCSNPWAPGGVNASWLLPNSAHSRVLCKAASTHAHGGCTFHGKGRKGDIVCEGKALFHWGCPREKSISLLIPAPVLDRSHARKLWPFRFWEKLPSCGPFLVPLLISYILCWCSKNRTLCKTLWLHCIHFLQIL